MICAGCRHGFPVWMRKPSRFSSSPTGKRGWVYLNQYKAEIGFRAARLSDLKRGLQPTIEPHGGQSHCYKSLQNRYAARRALVDGLRYRSSRVGGRPESPLPACLVATT